MELPSAHAAAALVIAIITFWQFASSKVRVEIVSLLLIAVLALLFYLWPMEQEGASAGIEIAFGGFAHEALIAICCLMILGRGLVVTGALEPAARLLTRLWAYNRLAGLLVTLVAAAFMSMIVNDTPVLVLLLPLLLNLATRIGASASKTLMPVNCAILIGGMATTIGTSTNLLVVSIARDLGLPPMGVFDFTGVALLAGLVALPYLWLVMPRLLPANGGKETDAVRRFQAARAMLLADFEAYLVKQRGLGKHTICHVLRFAERFLDHRFETGKIDLTRLRAADTTSFIQHVLAGRQSYRDKTITTHLRTFFQYLFARGATATNLALNIPKVAQRWNARLPRHLQPDGVEAVLASVRGNPRHGARDYAMLLLMARLGLRAFEVIAIQLDDIDWRAGELLVRGKGMLHDRLPISADVGEALSRYLREERGPAICRTMFVTHRAPHLAFKGGQIVNAILKDALAATGQKPVTPYVGSHMLRHSLATQLVNAGASLDEVGDVLRHRSRKSTMIYARLDIDGLRSVAQPWPAAGGVQ